MKRYLTKWKKAATQIINFQIKLLLGVVFFILILPYAFLFKLFKLTGSSKPPATSMWVDLPKTKPTIAELRRQS